VFSVLDIGPEVTAVPRDPILCQTRVRILQGCFLFGGFQSPASDKILCDLISKLWFLISLGENKKIHCNFSVKVFKTQFCHCTFDRISALLFLFLLVSSFLGWRQKIQKAIYLPSLFELYILPPQCLIFNAVSRLQLKHIRLLDLLYSGLLPCWFALWHLEWYLFLGEKANQSLLGQNCQQERHGWGWLKPSGLKGEKREWKKQRTRCTRGRSNPAHHPEWLWPC